MSCCCSTTAPAPAPGSGLVGVAPRLSSFSAPAPLGTETVSTRGFLAADPFPWWLAFLMIGTAIILGGNPK